MNDATELTGARMSGFLRTVVVTFCALLGSTALVCGVVDPYGILGMPPIPGLTAVKSAAATRLRLSKAYRVGLMDPATIVTGNSVTNLGIDPASPAWRPDHAPVFNLGVDGATLVEQSRYLLNALAVTHPKLVVLFTSFEDALSLPFGDVREAGAIDPGLRCLDDGRPNPGFALAHIKDLASATLSFRALADSVGTLWRQSGERLNTQGRDGFETDSPEETYAATQGTPAAVAKEDRDIAARVVAWSAHPTWSLAPLAVMIAAARASGADVVVAIPPAHVDIMAIRREAGVEPEVAAWRSALLRIVRTRAGPDDHGRVTLWDFSGLSRYVTTPIPLDHRMADPGRWFWDTAHFSPALGTLLIRRIETGGEPVDLGTLVMPDAGDDGADETQKRQWMATHPADVARIDALLASTRAALCGRRGVVCAAPSPARLVADDRAP